MTDDRKLQGPRNPTVQRTGRVRATSTLISTLRDLVFVETADDLSNSGFTDETLLFRCISVHMLGALDTFLRQSGHAEAVPDALRQLSSALCDADSGIKNDLLSPRRVSGRPPVAMGVLNSRGRVAAVQDFLMESGIGKEAAATCVLNSLGSDAVEKLRSQNDRNPLSWRTVDRWRTAVHEGSNRVVMGSGFEAMKKMLSDHTSESDPNLRAKKALSALRKVVLPNPPKFE